MLQPLGRRDSIKELLEVNVPRTSRKHVSRNEPAFHLRKINIIEYLETTSHRKCAVFQQKSHHLFEKCWLHFALLRTNSDHVPRKVNDRQLSVRERATTSFVVSMADSTTKNFRSDIDEDTRTQAAAV